MRLDDLYKHSFGPESSHIKLFSSQEINERGSVGYRMVDIDTLTNSIAEKNIEFDQKVLNAIKICTKKDYITPMDFICALSDVGGIHSSIMLEHAIGRELKFITPNGSRRDENKSPFFNYKSKDKTSNFMFVHTAKRSTAAAPYRWHL